MLISRAVEPSNRRHLEPEFTRVGEIKHLWWFPNVAYKEISLGSLLSDATDRSAWQTMTDYFLDRTLERDFYQSTGVVYVAAELAHLAEGCVDLRAVTAKAG